MDHRVVVEGGIHRYRVSFACRDLPEHLGSGRTVQAPPPRARRRVPAVGTGEAAPAILPGHGSA